MRKGSICMRRKWISTLLMLTIGVGLLSGCGKAADGFRPNRGCHEAIKEVYQRISYGKISYIVDADIKGFFDHIDHDWMMKFLEWNIQDSKTQ